MICAFCVYFRPDKRISWGSNFYLNSLSKGTTGDCGFEIKRERVTGAHFCKNFVPSFDLWCDHLVYLEHTQYNHDFYKKSYLKEMDKHKETKRLLARLRKIRSEEKSKVGES